MVRSRQPSSTAILSITIPALGLLAAGCTEEPLNIPIDELPEPTCFDYSGGQRIVGSAPVALHAARTMALVGDHAFVAAGREGLIAFDVSDPAAPALVSGLPELGFVSDIAVVGSTLALTTTQGVQLVEVSEPTAPVSIGSVLEGRHIHEIAAHQDYLYGTGADTLFVIALDDPREAEVVGRAGGFEFAGNLVATGNRVFMSAPLGDRGEAIVAVDTSDPRAPTLLGSTDLLYGGPQCMTARGDLVYAIDRWGVLHVLDFAIPEEPVILGSGGSVWTDHEAIALIGDLLYTLGDRKLRIFDCSDPTSPQQSESISVTYGFTALLVDEPFVHLAGYTGLAVVDLRPPDRSPPILDWALTGAGAWGVALDGEHVYVAATGAGLHVMELSVVDGAVISGTLRLPRSAEKLAVDGDLAVVMDDGVTLYAVDVSDPREPRLLGSVDMSGSPIDVALAGSWAYVADRDEGLHVVDLSEPRSPIVVNTLAAEDASDIVVDGSYAYLALFYDGVVVLDVRDPRTPQPVAAANAVSVMDVEIAGDRLFVSELASGVRIIDVSNPLAPEPLGAVSVPGQPRRTAVIGNHAYVASLEAGVQIVDISDPMQPQWIGTGDFDDFAVDVEAVGPYLFVAAGSSGLLVLPPQCP